ncbi:hypothetical protein L226DRAFT_525183 [Lentinus tigrinus ALCF2SS1-7]|uniref:uncharacterized protein n=1 Tax=Lentinus tigrinus ALCF2SS1-7 TaxID=1328758 RepID=UPI0011660302|nr:hypothetical protein L226DRAFT_525183 [Lentinus tigrinus ALCF2SS1-7]
MAHPRCLAMCHALSAPLPLLSSTVISSADPATLLERRPRPQPLAATPEPGNQQEKSRWRSCRYQRREVLRRLHRLLPGGNLFACYALTANHVERCQCPNSASLRGLGKGGRAGNDNAPQEVHADNEEGTLAGAETRAWMEKLCIHCNIGEGDGNQPYLFG